MGLKEKQAISDIVEKDIPKYEKRIQENGLTVGLKMDWDSFPQADTNSIDRCKTMLREFSTRFWDFGQNKIARGEIEKKIKQVKIVHDGGIAGEYEYALKLEGDTLKFSANLEKFTLTQSSKQKSLQDAIGELL